MMIMGLLLLSASNQLAAPGWLKNMPFVGGFFTPTVPGGQSSGAVM